MLGWRPVEVVDIAALPNPEFVRCIPLPFELDFNWVLAVNEFPDVVLCVLVLPVLLWVPPVVAPAEKAFPEVAPCELVLSALVWVPPVVAPPEK